MRENSSVRCISLSRKLARLVEFRMWDPTPASGSGGGWFLTIDHLFSFGVVCSCAARTVCQSCAPRSEKCLDLVHVENTRLDAKEIEHAMTWRTEQDTFCTAQHDSVSPAS